MKKSYKKPLSINHSPENKENTAFPAEGLALLAGYVAGRAVHNMMKATPIIGLEKLGR